MATKAKTITLNLDAFTDVEIAALQAEINDRNKKKALEEANAKKAILDEKVKNANVEIASLKLSIREALKKIEKIVAETNDKRVYCNFELDAVHFNCVGKYGFEADISEWSSSSC